MESWTLQYNYARCYENLLLMILLTNMEDDVHVRQHQVRPKRKLIDGGPVRQSMGRPKRKLITCRRLVG
jgi:hypothetical protein